MPKSDKKRVREALERWEARYLAETSDTPVPGHEGTGTAALAAASDWLRAEVKLAHDMLDDQDVEWAEPYLFMAARILVEQAVLLAKEIRDEAGI